MAMRLVTLAIVTGLAVSALEMMGLPLWWCGAIFGGVVMYFLTKWEHEGGK
jgi:hypothetical protein